VLGMPRKYRLKIIYGIAVSGLAGVITAMKFLPAVTGGAKGHALLYLILGLIIVMGGELFWSFISYSNRRWGKGAVVGVAVLVLLAFAGSGLLSQESKINVQNKLQSNMLMGQAKNIGNFSDFSYTSRIDIYKWAISLVKDRPLFGSGAGAWNALYHQHQDYLFYTSEVHNHFLQVLIEAGLLGLLAFLSMWIFMFYAVFKLKKIIKNNMENNSDIEPWILIWSVTVAALVTGLHAFIDFDLSLSALCIMLWTLLGLINAAGRIEKVYPIKNSSIAIFLAAGLVLFLLPLMSGQRMLAASTAYNGANHLFQQMAALPAGAEREEKLNEAADLALQASKTDPFNAYYPMLLAQASLQQYLILDQQQNAASLDKWKTIHESISAAEKLSPYDTRIRNAAVEIYMQVNDLPQALEETALIMETNPLDANIYASIIYIAVNAADQSLKQNDKAEAAKYLTTAINCGQKMKDTEKQLDPHKMEAPFWSGNPFILDQRAQYELGRACYLMGDYLCAKEFLKPLTEAQLDPALQVQAWYLAALYKMGDSNIQGLVQDLRSNNPQGALIYDDLVQWSPLV
ncbi:MAG TPA: O-antigen ligase family protein, partial [Syntrophomonas sp.]|nr:O-antigen ligase family protein [Syntrophomonas sp.]